MTWRSTLMLKLRPGKELKELPHKQKEKENIFAKKHKARRNQPITYRAVLRCRKWFRNLKGRQNSAREEELGVFRQM